MGVQVEDNSNMETEEFEEELNAELNKDSVIVTDRPGNYPCSKRASLDEDRAP